MENILTPRGADQSALALYDKLVDLASTGTYIAWSYLAQELRAEAARFTGDAARKRLDRAVDCEARARRGAQIEAVREGVRASLAPQPRFAAFADAWLSIGASATEAHKRSVEEAGHAATMEMLARTGGAL